MACISRFATAILSGETELALGTIMVKKNTYVFLTSSVVIEKPIGEVRYLPREW